MQAQPKEFKVRSAILVSPESISIVTYLKSILCPVLIKASDVIERGKQPIQDTIRCGRKTPIG